THLSLKNKFEMKYSKFAFIINPTRLNRYLKACSNDTRKAMTWYRKNLKLSQEIFTIISCFELALRNSIDRHYKNVHGADWLRNAAAVGGFFDNNGCYLTQTNINAVIARLNRKYTHSKLVAELGFGFWRYMFAPRQFSAAGRSLLGIFQSKPRSTPKMQYNHIYMFRQLVHINNLRNRIAHHEPVCFLPGQAIKNTGYARNNYGIILR